MFSSSIFVFYNKVLIHFFKKLLSKTKQNKKWKNEKNEKNNNKTKKEKEEENWIALVVGQQRIYQENKLLTSRSKLDEVQQEVFAMIKKFFFVLNFYCFFLNENFFFLKILYLSCIIPNSTTFTFFYCSLSNPDIFMIPWITKSGVSNHCFYDFEFLIFFYFISIYYYYLLLLFF